MSHTRQIRKKICEGVDLHFETSFSSFLHEIFDQYVTVYLVRICIYKTADEKAHTFLWRSKNERNTVTVYKDDVMKERYILEANRRV